MRHVVLENAALDALAADPAARATLPGLLAGIAAARGAVAAERCPRCVAARAAELQHAYATTKRAIPALSPGDRDALKRLLWASSVEVFLPTPGGGATAYKF